MTTRPQRDPHAGLASEATAKRGVRVKIVVPGKHADQQLVRVGSRRSWPAMIAAGVKFYEYQPTMYHCKLMIVDDLWVSVGSANIDSRSFRLNDEANLNVLSAGFAAEQIRAFEEDKTRAREVTLGQWKKRSLGTKLVEMLTSPFHRHL